MSTRMIEQVGYGFLFIILFVVGICGIAFVDNMIGPIKPQVVCIKTNSSSHVCGEETN